MPHAYFIFLKFFWEYMLVSPPHCNRSSTIEFVDSSELQPRLMKENKSVMKAKFNLLVCATIVATHWGVTANAQLSPQGSVSGAVYTMTNDPS